MKKVWAVLLLLVAAGQIYADEGMWVLKELNKQNLARIKELGFVPSYQQLYSETDPCVQCCCYFRWRMYRYYRIGRRIDLY